MYINVRMPVVPFAEAPFWKILKDLFTSRYLPGFERNLLQREVATRLKVELIFIVLPMCQEPRCYCDEHHVVDASASITFFVTFYHLAVVLVCIIFQCNTFHFR